MYGSQLQKTVVLVAGADERELTREALTVLGDEFVKRIASAKRLFIHPNLVTHFRKAATTSVEAVRGVLDHISLHRADEVLIGDAGFHDTKKAFKKFDCESLSRSGNTRLIDLNDDETVASLAYTSDFTKRPIGFSKTVAESDFNIVVVPAKMHSYYIVSLSIKTHIVGSMVVKRSPFGIHGRWPYLHTGYKPAHLTLTEVYADHPAQLAVIDGTHAMEGSGPAAGWQVNLGWLLASLNPVVADALAAYLMGFTPSDIGYLYHLNQKGFGPIDPKEMQIIGPDPATPPRPTRLRRELKRPSSYPAIMEWR